MWRYVALDIQEDADRERLLKDAGPLKGLLALLSA